MGQGGQGKASQEERARRRESRGSQMPGGCSRATRSPGCESARSRRTGSPRTAGCRAWASSCPAFPKMAFTFPESEHSRAEARPKDPWGGRAPAQPLRGASAAFAGRRLNELLLRDRSSPARPRRRRRRNGTRRERLRGSGRERGPARRQGTLPRPRPAGGPGVRASAPRAQGSRMPPRWASPPRGRFPGSGSARGGRRRTKPRTGAGGLRAASARRPAGRRGAPRS